jgi:glycine/serine hydroxymethyltransferase
MKEPEMVEIAELIARTLRGRDDDAVVEAVRADVVELCGRFTPYGN